jgi:trehalose 6-phosphate phosphatase
MAFRKASITLLPKKKFNMPIKLRPDKDALFLDIDGTILDIAPTARDVEVPPRLREDLKSLYEKLDGALAFISGRTIENIDKLFVPLRFPCAGIHGAQWRLSSTSPVESGTLLPSGLREECHAAFSGIEGILVEDKGWAVAIHYRQASIAGNVLEKSLSELIEKSGKDDLTLIHGRKVIEVTRSAYNKGQALQRFLNITPFKNRRPVFLGDDITDLSAIGAVMKHGGLAARVGAENPSASAFFSPDKVRSWLGKLVA